MRTVKTIKDKDNNDVEVYSDNCNKCSKEMVFPKAEADKLESIFPFLKDKIDKGTPCVECTKEMALQGNFSLYTDEELSMVRDYILTMKSQEQ